MLNFFERRGNMNFHKPVLTEIVFNVLIKINRKKSQRGWHPPPPPCQHVRDRYMPTFIDYFSFRFYCAIFPTIHYRWSCIIFFSINPAIFRVSFLHACYNIPHCLTFRHTLDLLHFKNVSWSLDTSGACLQNYSHCRVSNISIISLNPCPDQTDVQTLLRALS